MPNCRRCVTCFFVLAIVVAGAAFGQTDPIVCDNQAFIVQDDGTGNSAIISRAVPHNQDPSRFIFTDFAPNPLNMAPPGFGFDLNAMGFSRANGLLWGWRPVAGSAEVFMVDNNGTYTGWGVPVGAASLNNNFLGNAGDVSFAGDTLFVTQRTSGQLYNITLPADPSMIMPGTLAATEVTLVRPDLVTPINFAVDGIVADLAARDDGLLYGGDHTHGEIVVVDPATGVRTDHAVVGGPLLTGSQYGGAWFDSSFNRLYLFRNAGAIFRIDITAGPTFTLVPGSTAGPGSNKNDGAACVNDVLAAAKRMTADATSGKVTIELFFENLQPITGLNSISAIDDLTEVFGAAGVDWNFVSISSDVVGFHNPMYNGSTVTELVAPGQSLGNATQTSATITVVVGLLMLNPPPSDPPDPMLPATSFCNHVLVTGTLASGMLTGTVFGDFSTDSPGAIGAPLDPDPDGDGSPIESAPSCTQTMTTPVELQHFSIE